MAINENRAFKRRLDLTKEGPNGRKRFGGRPLNIRLMPPEWRKFGEFYPNSTQGPSFGGGMEVPD
jgi:hypothetical protein